MNEQLTSTTNAAETTTETATETKTGFESEGCTRCGGLGHYSYCQAYGTMCFRCQGKRITLTARGAAAKKFFEESCMVPAESLKVGDVVKTRYGFATITSIKPGDPNDGNKRLDQVTNEWKPLHTADMLNIETNRICFHTMPGEMVRKGQSADEKKTKLEAAYAYQATLTKAGKVSKRKAK
jgi:hypothetical protein